MVCAAEVAGGEIKNNIRHAPAFPVEVPGSEAMPAPHPIEETTNEPLPGSLALIASHQFDLGKLAEDCDPKAGDLANSTKPVTKVIKKL